MSLAVQSAAHRGMSKVSLRLLNYKIEIKSKMGAVMKVFHHAPILNLIFSRALHFALCTFHCGSEQSATAAPLT